MMEWLSWGVALQALIGAGLAVSLAFCLIGFASAWQFFHTPQPSREPRIPPGVSILKPLKGLEASLYENLATFCDQDYPTFQVVFGVVDADDPAVGVVRRLQDAYPGVRIDLVIDARVYGTNYKVSNLHNMYQTAAHEVIVLADSDMRVPRDYLRRVTAALADPTVGMVTCLYRALPTRGSANLIEALFINTTFAFLIMVARVVEKPTYAFGATMAMRRARLDEIGGFLPLVDYLADDYQLGNRIAARGYRLVLADLVVETVVAMSGWRHLVEHQLRWARTNRVSRPGGYLGSVLTHGTLWATLNVLYNPGHPLALLASAVVITVRVLVARRFATAFLGAALPWHHAVLVPFQDLFMSATWALAFLGDSVQWSGRRFRVSKDGRMIQVSAEPPRVPAYAARRLETPVAGDPPSARQ
jgi:ceramide glucosyltransferase